MRRNKQIAVLDLAADYNDIADLELAEIARLDLGAMDDGRDDDECDDASDYD